MKAAEDRPYRLPGVAIVIMVIGGLYLGRELLIPVALAVFLSFLLLPAVRALERLRLRRASATAIVVAASLAAVTAIGWLVVSQSAELIANYPLYRQNLLSKIRDLRPAPPDTLSTMSRVVEEIAAEIAKPVISPASQPVAEASEGELDSQASLSSDDPDSRTTQPATVNETAPVKVEIVPPKWEMIERFVKQLFGPVMSPLGTVGVAVVFVVFFLVYGEDLYARTLRLLARGGIHIPATALGDAGSQVMRYVSALGIANGINGAVIALGLFAIGLPSYLLWAAMAAVLRFIPVIGTWIAGSFPILLSIAIFDGCARPLLVVALILVVDLTSLNLFEPWLLGTRTGASPTAILFGYVFWTWLWGGIGLFLAAPIMVCLVALGRRIPALAGFSILLGDEPSRMRETR